MCYYKSDLNVQLLLKSAVRMREMPFQRHKFQNISEGGMPPDPTSWTRLTVHRLGAAYSSFSPGGKSASQASVNSDYTYCDFVRTPGFTALPYAKVLFSFVGEFWNKHPPFPQLKCSRYTTEYLRLLQLCQNPDYGHQIFSVCRFLILFRIIKFTV